MVNSIDNLTTFAIELFSELNQGACKYALLHNGDSLEKSVQSDVDIALGEHPFNRFLPILERTSKQHGLQLTQILHYEVPAGYYFILSTQTTPPVFLHLDCLYDPWGINRYYLDTPYLTDNTEQNAHNRIREVNAEKRALYLFIKRVIKGGISADRKEALKSLCCSSNPGQRTSLAKWFGEQQVDTLYQALDTPSLEQSSSLLKSLRPGLINRFRRQHPFRYLAHQVTDAVRKLRRYLAPTGFFIVILGPDGSGKSTVTTELRSQLDRCFRKTFQFHWRPNLLPKLGKSQNIAASATPDNTPSKVSKYRGWVSLARFVYYWLDFVAGYWLRIYPKKAQTTLIIGERYFPDILVHPERYGFSVSPALLRFASFFVPNPDLTILLTNEPEVIFSRKAELSIEEIRSQISAYELEMPHWGKHASIMTDAPPDVVAGRITELVIQICQDRIQQRIKK